MNSFFLYVKDSYNELVNNVTWPTMSELFSSATVVIIASIIIALIVALMDAVANFITSTLYNINF